MQKSENICLHGLEVRKVRFDQRRLERVCQSILSWMAIYDLENFRFVEKFAAFGIFYILTRKITLFILSKQAKIMKS